MPLTLTNKKISEQAVVGKTGDELEMQTNHPGGEKFYVDIKSRRK